MAKKKNTIPSGFDDILGNIYSNAEGGSEVTNVDTIDTTVDTVPPFVEDDDTKEPPVKTEDGNDTKGDTSNANDDVVNSHWVCNYLDTDGKPMDDQSDIYFYNRKYNDSENIYVGKIVDFMTTATDSYSNVYNFIYQVNGMGMITGAQITSVEFEHPAYQGTTARDFNLYFGGVNDDGLLLVCLWYETSSDIAPIFGSGYMDEEYQVPMIESWQGFTKVA